MNVNPHDLLWISKDDDLVIESIVPEWFMRSGISRYPVVVRREALPHDWIPVGIRGSTRSQRLAAKIKLNHVVKRVTPQSVVANYQHNIKKSLLPAMQALQYLIDTNLAWQWGITGSAAYQLVTDVIVMNERSDLDLSFWCPVEIDRNRFILLSEQLNSLPCKIDAQIETPNGAFALNEYVRGDKVMLKTQHGPILTIDPWQRSIT